MMKKNAIRYGKAKKGVTSANHNNAKKEEKAEVFSGKRETPKKKVPREK